MSRRGSPFRLAFPGGLSFTSAKADLSNLDELACGGGSGGSDEVADWLLFRLFSALLDIECPLFASFAFNVFSALLVIEYPRFASLDFSGFAAFLVEECPRFDSLTVLGLSAFLLAERDRLRPLLLSSGALGRGATM